MIRVRKMIRVRNKDVWMAAEGRLRMRQQSPSIYRIVGEFPLWLGRVPASRT
jgi:hypothetical protein